MCLKIALISTFPDASTTPKTAHGDVSWLEYTQHSTVQSAWRHFGGRPVSWMLVFEPLNTTLRP